MVVALELAQVLELVLSSEVLELAQVLELALGSEAREVLELALGSDEEHEVCGVAYMFQRSRMLVQFRLCTCLHGRYHS